MKLSGDREIVEPMIQPFPSDLTSRLQWLRRKERGSGRCSKTSKRVRMENGSKRGGGEEREKEVDVGGWSDEGDGEEEEEEEEVALVVVVGASSVRQPRRRLLSCPAPFLKAKSSMETLM